VTRSIKKDPEALHPASLSGDSRSVKCQMSNVPCRMSNVLDQTTNWPNWVVWSVGQVHLTFDIGRLTFDTASYPEKLRKSLI